MCPTWDQYAYVYSNQVSIKLSGTIPLQCEPQIPSKINRKTWHLRSSRNWARHLVTLVFLHDDPYVRVCILGKTNILCILKCWKDVSVACIDMRNELFAETPCYHRFRWYATLENKTLAETFPKFPSVLRVIDKSDRNPPITASSVTF